MSAWWLLLVVPLALVASLAIWGKGAERRGTRIMRSILYVKRRGSGRMAYVRDITSLTEAPSDAPQPVTLVLQHERVFVLEQQGEWSLVAAFASSGGLYDPRVGWLPTSALDETEPDEVKYL